MFLHFTQHIDFIREKSGSASFRSWNFAIIATFFQLTKRKASVGTGFVEAEFQSPLSCSSMRGRLGPEPSGLVTALNLRKLSRGRYGFFRCRLLQKAGCLPLVTNAPGVSFDCAGFRSKEAGRVAFEGVRLLRCRNQAARLLCCSQRRRRSDSLNSPRPTNSC
jgi:hypothetical protein